jgi:hypothetical protein
MVLKLASYVLICYFLPSVEVTLGFYHFSVDQQDVKQVFKYSCVYGFSVAVGVEKVQLCRKASCAKFLSIKFVNIK